MNAGFLGHLVERQSLTCPGEQPRFVPASVGTAPMAQELKGAINSGRGRDKVSFYDPAATPLGTDDEAATTPNTADRVATPIRQDSRTTGAANRHERSVKRRRPRTPMGSGREPHPLPFSSSKGGRGPTPSSPPMWRGELAPRAARGWPCGGPARIVGINRAIRAPAHYFPGLSRRLWWSDYA